ncbi:alkanesulfonate monooxygenase SsuD/methylene tetrahydromethanopterin reductase-like flavin-dependent oxidoreductase (luciferase family)/predicted kinase [Phycicoccus badiiscoriae]|uniref:Alkanesulfonate monooxygenase SsuD/methylene tetrahydromethanopterin reductase-like flavin-dependent oxidoreductase (Luciferase family)/predicted kinase n=1 Tax=Pedococcus badiiscoriae TaxID=642776 RepID=A0A852WBQ4_9MICO|nr:alkanesulfonate monooxygenase SsuD/methylene tetrahydromethanopterin reductase-like flavin-dependent oxidoreductase (luciferase family)/predicted kinase [Pedococcus badiiscoriae]
MLVGPSGAGKSTWAAQRYRQQEIVSSDALRAVVGSGEFDLDASADAFAILHQVVAARARRGLTVLVDTLGLDPDLRERLREQGRAAGLPCVAVLFDTDPAVCRERNSRRDRPVPAAVLGRQLAGFGLVRAAVAEEGWDAVLVVAGPAADAESAPAAASPSSTAPRSTVPRSTPPTGPTAGAGDLGLDVVIQLSRFPWGADPTGWLRSVVLAADHFGFSGIALMDHLIQIPQVDRAWEPIPEPWVTLGLLAGLDTRLRLGTLVSPVTFRAPGIIAKTVATLDVLSGGRAFVGLGAGWWEREHLAFGLPFPPPAERLDQLEASIETIRALWGKGTKAHQGKRVTLPETTAYPRPVGQPQIIVGGAGERRTLRIAAELADACNLPSDLPTLERKLEVLRSHCRTVGRDPDDVAVTVLDLPIVGRDRDDTWRRVERLRGRTPAATYARRHHAGEVAQHHERFVALASRGVQTVFVGLPDLEGPDDVERLAGVLTGR